MTDTNVPGADDPRPSVTPPRAGPPPAAIAMVLCLAGGGVIWASQAHLGAHNQASRTAPAVAVAEAPVIAPLDIPQAPPSPPPPPPPSPEIRYIQGPPPPPIIQYVNRPTSPQPQASSVQGRLAEPVLAIDLPPAISPADAATPEDTPAHAIVMHNRAQLVPQGALIPAVIETPIDSSEPGAVRAITAGDTKGFDGTRVLIPRGSHLIGEIKAGARADQTRVTIIWTRLVRPDGIAIKLSAPATDGMGGAGVEGKVDSHLLSRVGSAVLQSVVTVGVALASRPGNGSVVLGIPAQTAGGIVQAGAPAGENTPTVKVAAGTPIMVFVNRDMDFTGVLPRR